MRSRGSRRQDDSLELLLDTICNTFGGIIFIAILVVILLQQVDDRSGSVEASALPVSPAELNRRQAQLVRLESELESLRVAQSAQEEQDATLAPQETKRLVEQRNAAREEHRQQQVKRDALLVETASQQSQIEQTKFELASTDEDLARTKEAVAQLEEQIKLARAARHRELRTPVTRSPDSAMEIGLIVRYGRMYVWHKYDQSGRRLGLNTDEFVVVKEDADGVHSAPIPTAGIALDASSETGARIAQRLRQFSPREVHIAIVVRPDSFEHFAYLRDALLSLGFEYRLMPMRDGDAIVDRGGTDVRVQ